MAIEIGSEIEGKITGVAKFGAFVSLPEGKAGLVHISQVSDSYVTDIAQHLKVGDTVTVKVLGLVKGDKYDLSIKQVGKPAASFAPPRRPRPATDGTRPAPGSFEDKMTNFLKQSEEKLSDWKRNIEFKQSGRKNKIY